MAWCCLFATSCLALVYGLVLPVYNELYSPRLWPGATCLQQVVHPSFMAWYARLPQVVQPSFIAQSTVKPDAV
jgi:hypothetical protein